MQIIKYTLQSVWIIMFTLSSTLLWAQNEPYNGGNGSGFNSMNSSLVSCNTFRFAGGAGDGDSADRSFILNCSAFRFTGGIGDGDSAARSSLLNCSGSHYTGGIGDGDTAAKTNLLVCNASRFAGDTADGFDIVKTNLLGCNTFRFTGDTGSGYKSALFIKPRNFLGNDTSVTIICSDEGFNLLSLYNFNGITIAWNTPRPDSAVIGNYQAIGTTTGGCIDTAFALVKQEIAVWNGSISDDWHVAANWNSNRVPNEQTHVIIPGGTANPCIIKNADAKAASVQGKINGNFSIINNKNLLISGHCVQLPTGP